MNLFTVLAERERIMQIWEKFDPNRKDLSQRGAIKNTRQIDESEAVGNEHYKGKQLFWIIVRMEKK